MFNESNADFYDLEYFISLEYRYFSGAHGSRIRNIKASLGDIRGKRILDIGCGGGFLTNILREAGAFPVGIDYSPAAIQFAKERYPDIDFRVSSGYDFSNMGKFDIVTLFDVVEHMGDHDKLFQQIKSVLVPGGKVVISTDAHDSEWGKWKKFIRLSERFSKEGRAYRLIKKVENHRRKFRNYHASHIAEVGFSELRPLLEGRGFRVLKHSIYPLVGVPLRDTLLKLLPKKYHGDHQTIVAALR